MSGGCPHVPALQPFEGAHRLSPAVAALPVDPDAPTALTLRGVPRRRRQQRLNKILETCLGLLETGADTSVPGCWEVRTIPQDDPRVALRGQHGVYATADIPTGAVVGTYKSWAGTEDEFYGMPVSPLHWNHFDAYSYMSVDGLPIGGHPRPIYFSAYQVGNHTRFINDYRADAFTEGPPPDGGPSSAPNCAFAELRRHNRLHIFVVAIRSVQPEEELFLDYSQEYWDALRADAKRMRACSEFLCEVPLLAPPCLACAALQPPAGGTPAPPPLPDP